MDYLVRLTLRPKPGANGLYGGISKGRGFFSISITMVVVHDIPLGYSIEDFFCVVDAIPSNILRH